MSVIEKTVVGVKQRKFRRNKKFKLNERSLFNSQIIIKIREFILMIIIYYKVYELQDIA